MGLLRKPATAIPPAYPPQSRETSEIVQATIPETIHQDIFLYLERGAINHTISTFIKALHVELSKPESGFQLRQWDPANEPAVVAALARLNFGLGRTAAPSPKPKAQPKRRGNDTGAA